MVKKLGDDAQIVDIKFNIEDNFIIDNYYYLVYIINMNDIHNPSTHRITSQQQAIYRHISSRDQHYSAEDVFTEIKKIMPRISLATVYRNLEKLVQSQLISKVAIAGKSYFDRRVDDHYHVVCLRCQRVDNLDSIPASDIESFFSRSTTYKLISHELVLYGICVPCQKNR